MSSVLNSDVSGIPGDLLQTYPEFAWEKVVSRCGELCLYECTWTAQNLKVLLLPLGAELFSSPEAVSRFLEGLALVQQVEHPAILKVQGSMQRNGGVCVVYEPCSGQPLAGLMKQHLKGQISLNMMGAVAQGMAAAHAKQCLHGDINPAWILVGMGGQVHLAGLGISRLLYPGRAFYEAMIRRPSALRSYLAPEQMGETTECTDKTDIYAMGALSYHLLTGSPLGGFVVLPSRKKEVGTFTDDVVFRATMAKPEERYETMEAFAIDIVKIGSASDNRHLLFATREQARRNQMRRQKKVKVGGLIATIVLTVGGIGGFAAYTLTQKAEEAKKPGPPPVVLSAADQARILLAKHQKEAALAIVAAGMQTILTNKWTEEKLNSAQEFCELAVQAGRPDMALDFALKLQLKLPPDSPDMVRVARLVAMLKEGIKAHDESMNKARQHMRDGDEAAARNELARADAALPGHPSTMTALALLKYDPAPGLKDLLRAQLLPDRSALRFSLRVEGLMLYLDLAGNSSLKNLAFLKGQPITHLDISRTGVSDLSTLSDLPLHALHADHTPVTDLRPLRLSTLRELTCEGCQVADAGMAGESLFLTSFRISMTEGVQRIQTAPARRWQTWINPLGMRFLPVPGQPALLFSEWETRVTDYRRYASAAGLKEAPVMVAADGKGGWATSTFTWEHPPLTQGEDHPVVGVSCQDAHAFCVWLTSFSYTAGLIPPGAKYRLPTSAEWSAAVGMPAQSSRPVYPWGVDWPPQTPVGNYSPSFVPAGIPADSFAFTSPVGMFRNGCALRDAGGNVREWCTGEKPETALLRDASCQEDLRHFKTPSETLRLDAVTLMPATARDSTAGFRAVLDFGS